MVQVQKFTVVLAVFSLGTGCINGHENEIKDASGKKEMCVPFTKALANRKDCLYQIRAAYTYQVASQEGMTIASTPGTAGLTGNSIRPRLKAASGFKLAASSSIFHDGWGITANYQWFTNQAPMKRAKLIGGLLYTSSFWNNATTYNQISSQFKNQFNRIDLSLEKEIYTNHYISFVSSIGVLTCWEHQNLNFNMTESTAPNTVHQNKLDQQWWGIGPYVGAYSDYYFTCDWASFVRASGSILLANHQVKEREALLGANGLPASNGYALSDQFANVEPMIDLTIGLFYENFFYNAKLRVDVGWQVQTYFSHNGMLSYYGPMGVMGNYSMQGLVVGARFSF